MIDLTPLAPVGRGACIPQWHYLTFCIWCICLQLLNVFLGPRALRSWLRQNKFERAMGSSAGELPHQRQHFTQHEIGNGTGIGVKHVALCSAMAASSNPLKCRHPQRRHFGRSGACKEQPCTPYPAHLGKLDLGNKCAPARTSPGNTQATPRQQLQATPHATPSFIK